MIAYREEMSPAESISKQMCLKTTLELGAELIVSLYGDYVIILEEKLGWNRGYTLAPSWGREFFIF